jgi:hypothetical protein
VVDAFHAAIAQHGTPASTLTDNGLSALKRGDVFVDR